MTLKENSNIRRIDDLGRIVIPKDIRKKLHIKNNEPLEIYIEDGEIKIKKYSSLPDIIEYIKYLVDIGTRITGNNYIITDREHIIASTNESLVDSSLDSKLDEYVSSSKEEKNINIDLIINDMSITGKANIVPIIIDNDRSGIIIEYNNVLDSNYTIKIFKNLIEERLNNY